MSEVLLITIITGIFSVAVAVTGGIFARGNKQKENEKKRDMEVRMIRNEKDAMESKKDRAHDALSRQIAWHIIDGNDIEVLKAKFEAANAAEEEWTIAERRFYEKHDEVEAKYR